MLAQSVFGLQVDNLFNQLYNVPVVNGCYGTPVTTGLASGNAPCTYSTRAVRAARRAGALLRAVSDLSECDADFVSALLPGDDMTRRFISLFALRRSLSPLLGGCGNGGASEPPITSFDPAATSKLQFAVGVATIAYNGGQSVAYGLNTVATLRQSDGLSGTLYNIPHDHRARRTSTCSISTQTGNEVQSAGADLGTNHITWATLNQSQWTGHRAA